MGSLALASGVGSFLINDSFNKEEFSDFQKKCSEEDGENGEKSVDDIPDSADNLDDCISCGRLFIGAAKFIKTDYPPFAKTRTIDFQESILIPPPNR